MTIPPLPKASKGGRPTFLDSADSERLLNMVVALAGEVSLLHDKLDSLARVLKPGAELRFATDDKSYLPYALERLMAHPAFAWTATGCGDWKGRPADWPPTRYEAKAIKGPPTFLRFRRMPCSG